MRREDMKKMPTGSKMPKKNGELAPESEIVEKKQGNYKSRYSGELSPEKDIVEGPYTPTYNSRYK